MYSVEPVCVPLDYNFQFIMQFSYRKENCLR